MSTTDGAFTVADHVTQREPGPWRDCTFASMLEVCRDGFTDGRSIPATEAEKEALRAAAGLPDDHSGATIAHGILGAERRYGLGGGYVVSSSWAVVRDALNRADARCIVQGSMGSATTWLRRWQPTFSGPHAVAARGLTWCDPLAPQGAYVGEMVPMGAWESYFRGLPGAQAFITTVGGLTRMAGDYAFFEPLVESRRTGKVKGGTVFYNDWALTDRRGSFSRDATIQLFGYRSDAYAIQVNTGQGWADGKLRPTNVFVRKSSVTGIVDVADQTPYSQADVDAAYARGQAEGDTKHTVTLQIDGAEQFRTEV